MSVDYAGFETKRRNVETGWAANVAANDYGRHVSQQRGARTVGDQSRQFSRSWAPKVAAWGRRGQTGPNVNSGFYQQAMQDYVGDYGRARNDTLQGLADEQTGYDMQAAQMDAQRQQALADLEAQKQRQIAELAQNIAAVRPNI